MCDPALGGPVSGVAPIEQELQALVQTAFVNSPQAIVDKSLKGWQELGYKVVRGASDNCSIVCSMANLGPSGIQTGDGTVSGPALVFTRSYASIRECQGCVQRNVAANGERYPDDIYIDEPACDLMYRKLVSVAEAAVERVVSPPHALPAY